MSAAIWNEPDGEPAPAHPGLGPITIRPAELPARNVHAVRGDGGRQHTITLRAYNVAADGTRYTDAGLVALGLARKPTRRQQ